MSEIYLTKIERKTIFTKSLIFVLVMFIISDMTVTGPFYFNFIPWLYIVGIVGSIKKIDSILMSVIGTFTVFISSIIINGSFTLSCVINPLISLGLLILGIISGKLIYEFILEHRLVKYLKPSKKTIYITLILLMLVVSFVTVALHKGDIVTYIISKNNLESYILDTYNTDEIKIMDTKYSKDVPGKYIYTVKIKEQEVYFVPVTKVTFKDANYLQRLEILNGKLANEMKDITQNVVQKYPLLKDINITYKQEYTKLDVVPSITAMYLSKTYKDINLDKLYEELSLFINEIIKIKEIDKVVININNNVLQLSKTDLEKLTGQYIKDGFEVEQISE